MPELTNSSTRSADQKLDRQLLLSLAIAPLAAGISTIVGYTVAHWITVTASKRTGYLVSACCFVLCAASALLAWNAQRSLASADETHPEDGRRMFMAKLALLLAALCTLVVFAGVFILLILHPDD